MNKINIAVTGASGKMGQAIIEAARDDEEINIISALVRENSEYLHKSELYCCDLHKFIAKADVIIDFSNPELCMNILEIAKKPIVIGTTGFTNSQQNKIKQYAENYPLLQSANMSMGVNILLKLVQQTAEIIGQQADIEIVEMHHNRKIDAPSGTALALGKAAAAGLHQNFEEIAKLSREGITGKRPKGEIGFATLRGGDVVGEHNIIFAMKGERLELAHKASNRGIFAYGAINAAKWIIHKNKGIFSMVDIF